MDWMDDGTNRWMEKNSRKTTTTSFTICNSDQMLHKKKKSNIAHHNNTRALCEVVTVEMMISSLGGLY
jgi:hypothetical protein